jgi:low temperature requirement protein LtrA
MMLAYVLCTLAVIQIWNFSTYYINVCGKNGLREHIFLFTNMFLLYFVAEGTSEHWQTHHTQYHAAWGLILLNIALQYVIEMKGKPRSSWKIHILVTLIAEALLVFAMIPIYKLTGKDFSYVPIVFGIISASIPAAAENRSDVDFAHLSERAMLYVVYTFGEMVIAIAGYFKGSFSFNNIYFALFAFLIVVGLFLSYGTFYDKIIDREQQNSGLVYMFLHIFIIFGLNNITTSLEFMRDEQIELVQKITFLLISFVMYYIFLLLTLRFAKLTCKLRLSFYLRLAAITVSFAALMILSRKQMYINIAISAAYVFVLYAIIYRIGKKNSESVHH